MIGDLAALLAATILGLVCLWWDRKIAVHASSVEQSGSDADKSR